jgi:fumarate reductase flavoprotein subunit
MAYDVCVVGGGPAGLAAALAAAERGLLVVVLEKDVRLGGALHYSGGHVSGAGTRAQAAKGIADSVAAHWDDIQRISMGTGREDLTRLSVELQPGTVDWLEDLGVEWDPLTPRLVFGHEPYRTARTVHTSRMAVPIAEALERALAPHLESGRIEVRLSTPAAGLVVDGGRVTGVRTELGEVVEARDTVLATGGFGHNPELFRRYEKAPLVTSAAPGSTGDGLVMALEAGAAVQGEGKYLPTFGGLPPEPGELRVDWVHRPHLVAPERKPWEIYVDQAGRRWINEEEPSIDRKERVLVTIPEMTFWTVFDARALRESRPMILGMSAEEVDAAAGVRRGITKADTIPELAKRAGIAVDGLAATVARYNHATSMGREDDFGRRHRPAPIAEAPFYAIENHPVTLITFSGVDVDADLRVRRPDGSVIEGLHAVGEVIGAAAFNGNSFCSGMVLTPALALGRLVGARLGGAPRHEIPHHQQPTHEEQP